LITSNWKTPFEHVWIIFQNYSDFRTNFERARFRARPSFSTSLEDRNFWKSRSRPFISDHTHFHHYFTAKRSDAKIVKAPLQLTFEAFIVHFRLRYLIRSWQCRKLPQLESIWERPTPASESSNTERSRSSPTIR
jgi:hypothetical protein